jgi:undecaprenyl-diphosphatase
MSIWQAIILAIVEGITEFLPVSSTGHMIIASSFMGISHLEFTKMFTVNIQFGAILSVLVLYWKRFFQTTDFYFKLFVAFLPAAVIGFLLNDFIDSHCLKTCGCSHIDFVLAVSCCFHRPYRERYPREGNYLLYRFKIGFFQCIAMIPGVSSSASTIIGGMLRACRESRPPNFLSFLPYLPWLPREVTSF